MTSPCVPGLSCEECAPGHYRAQTGPYGGYCVPCNCNGHSETCDPLTGKCYVSALTGGGGGGVHSVECGCKHDAEL